MKVSALVKVVKAVKVVAVSLLIGLITSPLRSAHASEASRAAVPAPSDADFTESHRKDVQGERTREVQAKNSDARETASIQKNHERMERSMNKLDRLDRWK